METTNEDLLKRINMLELKVDLITVRMEQAMGAWFFVKIMGSVAIGITVLWNAVREWFK